jgi:hypothetical protein
MLNAGCCAFEATDIANEHARIPKEPVETHNTPDAFRAKRILFKTCLEKYKKSDTEWFNDPVG